MKGQVKGYNYPQLPEGHMDTLKVMHRLGTVKTKHRPHGPSHVWPLLTRDSVCAFVLLRTRGVTRCGGGTVD